MGRVNFGFRLKDFKGLVGDILIENFDKHFSSIVTNFKVTSLPFDSPFEVESGEVVKNKASIYEYEIDVECPRDYLLAVKGFTRGFVLVNDFNIGRHWDIAYNSNKLYVPKTLLKKGKNKIIVFDILENEKEKKVTLGD